MYFSRAIAHVNTFNIANFWKSRLGPFCCELAGLEHHIHFELAGENTVKQKIHMPKGNVNRVPSFKPYTTRNPLHNELIQ